MLDRLQALGGRPRSRGRPADSTGSPPGGGSSWASRSASSGPIEPSRAAPERLVADRRAHCARPRHVRSACAGRFAHRSSAARSTASAWRSDSRPGSAAPARRRARRRAPQPARGRSGRGPRPAAAPCAAVSGWRPARVPSRPTGARAARCPRPSGRAAALAGPGDEAHDASPAQLIERGAAGDLVQPGARAGWVLERVEGPVGLDEGLLRQVGRQLVVAQHPGQVGVDLAGVQPEQLLDDGSRGRPVARHGARLALRGIACER